MNLARSATYLSAGTGTTPTPPHTERIMATRKADAGKKATAKKPAAKKAAGAVAGAVGKAKQKMSRNR